MFTDANGVSSAARLNFNCCMHLTLQLLRVPVLQPVCMRYAARLPSIDS